VRRKERRKEKEEREREKRGKRGEKYIYRITECPRFDSKKISFALLPHFFLPSKRSQN